MKGQESTLLSGGSLDSGGAAIPSSHPSYSSTSLPSTDLETDSSEPASHISLIHEERKENEILRSKNATLEEHIRILSNRLSNLGESTDRAVGDREFLIPETSKTLIDNILRENIILKREQSLKHQKITEMESAKDLKIAEMQRQLDSAQNVIEDLAKQCQQLVDKPEEPKTKTFSDNFERLSLDNNDEGVELRKVITNLRTELQQQKEQHDKVVACNARWEDYNRQREDYVKQLSRDLDEYKHSTRKFCEENRSLENQVRRLNQVLNQVQLHTKSGMSQEEGDRMHALERQVQEYTAAYKQAQKEREQVQTKVADLEDTNYVLKKQLEQFQTTQMNYLADRRLDAMRRHRMEYEQQHPHHSPYNQRAMIAHGTRNFVVADGEEDDVGEDEDIIDLPMSHGMTPDNQSSSSSDAQNSLECPKCKRQFPVSDPMQFLEHNDACQG